MSEDLLVTRGLTKVFQVGFRRRKVVAVDNLDLTVQRGEVFGFLGPNGAGKSTTIKLLMGLIFPTRGEARIFDAPIPTRSAKARIGFLPENPYFYDFQTPVQLLRFAGQICGIGRGDLDARIPKLLDLVGLTRFKDLPLRRFSKGMVQRAGIAQALINDPVFVVLDEPMSGLDPLGRKDVREVIFRLKDEGKTVFFSTHILPDVEVICDRVGLMLGGRLKDTGRLEDLLSARTEAVDVVVDKMPEANKEALLKLAARVVPKGGGLLLTFAEEAAADEAVRALVAAGARVVSLTRHRETLEDLFVRRANEASKQGSSVGASAA